MKKKNKIGFKIWCVAASLVAVFTVAYTLYEIFVLKIVEGGNIFRAIVILLMLALSVLQFSFGKKSKKLSPKILREHYRSVIGEVFVNDPKMEKRFFGAVNLRNQNEYNKAIKAFDAMEAMCRCNEERFAVTIFKALCYDDLKMYAKAAEIYEKALTYREDSTATSNLGLCYQRMGDFERAISAYEWSIKIEPKNAFPYNNIAQLYIRQNRYEDALSYSKKALKLNANMHPAWSAKAICCAMMGHMEDYEKAYRRAVACGANGEDIKDYIHSLCGKGWKDKSP